MVIFELFRKFFVMKDFERPWILESCATFKKFRKKGRSWSTLSGLKLFGLNKNFLDHYDLTSDSFSSPRVKAMFD